ncbi:MAG: hypothetical protein ACQEXJ_12040 [Myxococcota bacterium]
MPIRRIVSAAMTAPTGENCQPFRFTWDGERLAVHHDAERARHRLNAGDHASLLSLGAVAEAIDLAAAAEDLSLRFDLRREPRDDVWAEVRLEPARRPTDPLVHALERRETDRRPYRGGDLGAPVFAQVHAEAERFPRCRLGMTGHVSRRLMRFLLECDEIIWRDRQTVFDALRWVRFTDDEVRRTRDGMTWRNLGYLPLQARATWLLTRWPAALDLAKLAGGKAQTRFILRRQIRSAAGLGCIALRDTGPESLVDAGRLALRVWVRLNRAGYAFQPMSLPSLCVYNERTGVLPSDLPEVVTRRLSRGHGVLTSAFGLPASAHPVWMFRTGRREPLPRSLRSLRRGVDDVLRVVDGSAETRAIAKSEK